MVSTIRPFPEPFRQLADRFWTRLDAVLEPEQQTLARQHLQLGAKQPRPGIRLSELVQPGILGWAGEGCQVEITREGTWWRWHIVRGQYDFSSGAPQLPPELLRFDLPAQTERNEQD